jgi:glucose uptake protein
VWTSTFKAAKPYRYELYYLDFSLGALIFAAIAAFTLGSLRSSELTFSDNLLITGYRQMAYAFAAGVAFNIGSLILMAGVSVGGIALCVPAAWGIALVIMATWDYIADLHVNAVLLFGGEVLLIVAIAVVAIAYFRNASAVAEAAKKAFLADPRVKSSKRRARSAGAGSALILSLIAGIVLGFSPRVANLARYGENGISPYGLVLLFTCGMLGSTIVFMPFTLAFPVGGSSTSLAEYFRAKGKNHLLGILGGLLFGASTLAYYVVTGTPAAKLVGPDLVTGLAQAAPLLAILLGVFVWKEFSAVATSTMPLVWGGFCLYGIGVALISFAPVYGAR